METHKILFTPCSGSFHLDGRNFYIDDGSNNPDAYINVRTNSVSVNFFTSWSNDTFRVPLRTGIISTWVKTRLQIMFRADIDLDTLVIKELVLWRDQYPLDKDDFNKYRGMSFYPWHVYYDVDLKIMTIKERGQSASIIEITKHHDTINLTCDLFNIYMDLSSAKEYVHRTPNAREDNMLK